LFSPSYKSNLFSPWYKSNLFSPMKITKVNILLNIYI
jgi:hypothetical protein